MHRVLPALPGVVPHQTQAAASRYDQWGDTWDLNRGAFDPALLQAVDAHGRLAESLSRIDICITSAAFAGAEACARLLVLADKYRVDECMAAAACCIHAEVSWLLREPMWRCPVCKDAVCLVVILLTSVQASTLTIEQVGTIISLLSGKDCEQAAAVASLASLRQALQQRLLQLLGKLDDMMNDAALLASFCRLPLAVLEVRGGVKSRCYVATTCCSAWLRQVFDVHAGAGGFGCAGSGLRGDGCALAYPSLCLILSCQLLLLIEWCECITVQCSVLWPTG